MSKHFYLNGRLLTESPIQITPPNARELDMAKEVAWENTVVGGEVVRSGIVSGTTLRGSLRRACVQVALFENPRIEEKPLVKDYTYLVHGGVKGDGKQGPDDIRKRSERRDLNPIIALFGAADPWDTGRAAVPHAYIDHDQVDLRKTHYGYAPLGTQIMGSRRTDDFAVKEGIFDLLEEGSFDTWAASVTERKADSVIRKEIAEIEKKKKSVSSDERRVLDAEIEVLKEQKSGNNSLLMTMNSMSLMRGLPLRHDMHLRMARDYEMGLLLAGMDHHWRENPHFGGKTSLGYGLISGEYHLRSREGRVTEDLGVIRVIPHEGLDLSGSPQAKEFINAWKQHMMTADMNLRHEAA